MPRGALALLLAAYFSLTLAYSLLVPVWEAPDESEHLQYIHYLARNARLPEQLPSIQPTGNHESDQTPLYYLLGALATVALQPERLDDIRANPYVTWPGHEARLAAAAHSPVAEAWPFSSAVLVTHIARLVSILLGAVTVTFAFLLARRAARSNGMALIAAASVAFLPGFLFSSATVSNDTAVIAAASAVAFFVLDPNVRLSGLGRLAAIAALLAIVVVSKLSGIVVVAAAGGSLALARMRPSRIVVVCAPALAAALAWGFAREWRPELFGRHDPALGPTVSLADVGPAAAGFARSFVGVFGWQNVPLPDPIYLFLGALTVPVLVGLVRSGPSSIAGLALWPLLIAASVISRWAFSVRPEGYEHARFFYPALVPLSALAAVGWSALPRRAAPLSAAILPVGLLATAVMAIPLAVLPAYQYRERIAEFVGAVPKPGALSVDLSPTPGLRLVAYEMRPPCAQPGDPVSVSLFWQAATGRPPSADTLVLWRTPGGIAEYLSQKDPGRGFYPTSLWLTHDVVHDEHEFRLPANLREGRYSIEVGFVPFDDARRTPAMYTSERSRSAETTPLVTLAWDPRAGVATCEAVATESSAPK